MEVVKLDNEIKAAEIMLDNAISFNDVNAKGNPLKTIGNFKQVLDKHKIEVSYDEIAKDICFNKFDDYQENERLTILTDICIKEGLNVTEDKVASCIKVIAKDNKINPFKEIIEFYKNDNPDIIEEVFDTLEIDYPMNVWYGDLREYYFEIFYRWCINLVHLSLNSIANGYQSEGLLVLLGKQGCYKSTWVSKLMPNKKLFLGDRRLDPNNKDSIIENTKYLLVELAELDSTMKAEQSSLKGFITSKVDKYRAPFDKVAQTYPRVTTFIGTVNKKNFLKDETGNRRYFIIPVISCDVKALDKIDMCKFWGRIYNDYLNGEDWYLSQKYKDIQEAENQKYLAESDLSIMLDEAIDQESPDYHVYNVSEICEKLGIPIKGAAAKIKIEMQKRGVEYKQHKINNKPKWGYKIHRFKNQF